MPSALWGLSDAGPTVSASLAGQMWECASFPSIDGAFEPFAARLFRVRLFFLSFSTVIVSCIETKFSGVSSHIISNLYTKHSAPLSSPHLLWCIFIPGVPDVHVNLCWREPCFQHEQIPSFDAVDADVKRYFDIIMSAAVWTMWTCLIFKINELFILFQRTKHQKSDRSRKSLEWTQIFLY